MAEHQRWYDPKLSRDDYGRDHENDAASVPPESGERERQQRIDQQHSRKINSEGEQEVHWSWLSLKVTRLILFLLSGCDDISNYAEHSPNEYAF